MGKREWLAAACACLLILSMISSPAMAQIALRGLEAPSSLTDSPPTVTITSPLDNAILTVDNISVQGTAVDDLSIMEEAIVFVDNGWFIATASVEKENGMFSAAVRLHEGLNIITAFAIDDTGNVGSDEITVVCTVNVVHVLVDSSIYSDIATSLNQWVVDVEASGFSAQIYAGAWETPENVREFLQGSLSEGLVGALLVGDIPAALYEVNTAIEGYEIFDIDLYYMDLDGTWSDSDANGIYDEHGGDVAPEIWVGRLRVGDWIGDEVQLLNNYFDKNHRYRTGELSLPKRALMYLDDEYAQLAWIEEPALRQAYDKITLVKGGASAEDYSDRLTQGYEWVHLRSHSLPREHEFSDGSKFYYTDYLSADPRAFFYQLVTCYGAYLGEAIISTNTYGLSAIGSTKIGAMFFFGEFYESLADGETIGAAFQEWFTDYGWLAPQWFYGMTIIGDPTLRLPTPELYSFVDTIEPYWQTVPHTITATAEALNGVQDVALWYRYSAGDFRTRIRKMESTIGTPLFGVDPIYAPPIQLPVWSDWKLFGVDNEEPWEWEFDAPEGDGYYEFYSIATDEVGNTERPPLYAYAKSGIDTIPPDEPTLHLPEEGIIVHSNTLTFSWSEATDFSGVTCTLVIDNGNDFAEPVVFIETGLTSNAYTLTLAPSEILWNGTYYWRVQAVDGAGNVGNWSNTQSFTADVLASFVNPLRPWQPSTPFAITATGITTVRVIENIELWYRRSPDGETWGNWQKFGVDEEEPWEWEFDAPEGDGYYEFYSIATDILGLIEPAPEQADDNASTVVDTTPPGIVDLAAAPNPFSPDGDGIGDTTIISYALIDDPFPTLEVTITIYDINHDLVRELFDGAEEAGLTGIHHEHAWDGTDNNGEIVPNGQYIYEVIATTSWGNVAGYGGVVVVDTGMTVTVPTIIQTREKLGYVHVFDKPRLETFSDLVTQKSSNLKQNLNNHEISFS